MRRTRLIPGRHTAIASGKCVDKNSPILTSRRSWVALKPLNSLAEHFTHTQTDLLSATSFRNGCP
jgi:hypothetical protein